MVLSARMFFFFFFNDTATTEIYPLSLHDALPICSAGAAARECSPPGCPTACPPRSTSDSAPPPASPSATTRSEEHTSELQSRLHLVCRLLLEKKNRRPARSGSRSNTGGHYRQKKR